MGASSPFSLRAARPPLRLGALCAVATVALVTALIEPLKEVAPVVSTSVLYLLPVLLVSAFWGGWMGVATSLGAALAFNFFHISPTGRLTIADGENWVALGMFLIVAAATSTLANLARARASEAELRRREADLTAELARVLLGAPELERALGPAGRRIADALRLDSAELVLGDGAPAHALRFDGGALIVAADLPEAVLDGLRERLLPALETLLAAALQRDALTREVVESQALRRSDDLKTALLRAVSHDLRSPLTAIVAAGDALRSDTLDGDDRRELAGAVGSEGRRLSRLVDQLLDLSRLEAGAAAPRTDWCSIEELLQTAIDGLPGARARCALSIERELPDVRADAAQLERAFANLIDNALRHSDGPVTVRALRRPSAPPRLVVRTIDHGPGIPAAERERIFEPFHRGDGGGSGLGLAVARGFVTANGGTLRVESLPGQGSTFIVELPLEPVPAAVAP